MEDYFVIGKIANAHGIRGEIKVVPETEDINRFKDLDKVGILKAGKVMDFKCLSTRTYKDLVFIFLEGIDTRDKAISLKNSYLIVSREDAIDLEEDRHFIVDLIGCKVYEEGSLLGQLKDVLQPGGNDVYEVVDEEGRSLFIPVIYDVVRSIDIEKKEIEVKLLPGLREIYYED